MGQIHLKLFKFFLNWNYLLGVPDYICNASETALYFRILQDQTLSVKSAILKHNRLRQSKDHATLHWCANKTGFTISSVCYPLVHINTYYISEQMFMSIHRPVTTWSKTGSQGLCSLSLSLSLYIYIYIYNTLWLLFFCYTTAYRYTYHWLLFSKII